MPESAIIQTPPARSARRISAYPGGLLSSSMGNSHTTHPPTLPNSCTPRIPRILSSAPPHHSSEFPLSSAPGLHADFHRDTSTHSRSLSIAHTHTHFGISMAPRSSSFLSAINSYPCESQPLLPALNSPLLLHLFLWVLFFRGPILCDVLCAPSVRNLIAHPFLWNLLISLPPLTYSDSCFPDPSHTAVLSGAMALDFLSCR